MEGSSPIPDEVADWLRQFARCVRERKYADARPLFDEGVYSFGTVASRAVGLENLISNQWREVWDSTEGFDFVYDDAYGWIEGDLVGVALRWSSFGRDTDASPFERQGRATLILRLTGGLWKAVHSHFSMNP